MAIKKLLAVAAAAEAATGLALVIYPSLVVWLLFGAGTVMSCVAGMTLIALGLACWPEGDGSSSGNDALRGMLSYNLLATLYLDYLGIGGEWVGKLLWQAVVVHAGVTVLLARAWFALTSADR